MKQIQHRQEGYTTNEYAKRDDDRNREIDFVMTLIIIIITLLIIVRMILW